jgi:hypothetical protein
MMWLKLWQVIGSLQCAAAAPILPTVQMAALWMVEDDFARGDLRMGHIPPSLRADAISCLRDLG